MHQTTFAPPDLTAYTRLDELGLTVTGQHLSPVSTTLACTVTNPDEWCQACGGRGRPRDTFTRRLAHTPLGWQPTTLLIRARRYQCRECGRVWREDLTRAASPRARLSRHGLAWALEGLVCQHLSISRIAAALGVSWNTANTAVLAEGHRRLISDPDRFTGITTIGVDEHVWRHTRRGDKYVTVIIDLSPRTDNTGPARLLDMIPGRSAEVFATWLQARPQAWREAIGIVAMDGFTGYKTAAGQEVPQAVTVMDPFHVVHLVAGKLDQCRQRIQHQTLGHRGRKGDPLYGARRTLHTGKDLLTEKQARRLDALFAIEEHIAVEVTWEVYQKVVAAYRCEDRAEGKRQMQAVIALVTSGVSSGLKELITLGRTFKQRAEDILAFFDRPGSSNGPSEAINGRLEHLRGIALGFRSLTNYVARSLLEAGGFRPALHPQL